MSVTQKASARSSQTHIFPSFNNSRVNLFNCAIPFDLLLFFRIVSRNRRALHEELETAMATAKLCEVCMRDRESASCLRFREMTQRGLRARAPLSPSTRVRPREIN